MNIRSILTLALVLGTACTDDSEPTDLDAGADGESTDAASDDGDDDAMADSGDDDGGGDGAGDDGDGDGEFEGPSAADDPACAEDFTFCGDLLVPSDFDATPRSLVIALYSTIPPAGPPDAVLAEIEAPELIPGNRYPVVLAPVTTMGDYHVWFNLYVEGGGAFIPENGVDYMGFTADKVTLDGSPFMLDGVMLEPASGF